MILLAIYILISTAVLVLYHRILYITLKTLPRDLKAGYRFLKLNFWLSLWEYRQKTVAKIFQSIAKKHPHKVAFYFEDEQWTFQDVEDFSNQVANYFKEQGYKKGDTVALVLESCPEYPCIWLGLSKIGIVTALINYNLVAESLHHSITAANAKAVVFGSDFKKAIEDLGSQLSHHKLYQFNDKGRDTPILHKAANLRNELDSRSIKPPVEDIKQGTSRDKLIYIYTSGTTGLPKAAVISNMRFFFMTMGTCKMIAVGTDDIIYDPLPLYHSAGGVIGAGQCLLNGVTVVIRKKFSASSFWSDCIRYKCTVAQYIGETCRYILAAHSKNDKPIGHNIRLMFGNGLRPQIWEQFVKRFSVPNICEFYGATESNSNLVNIDNKVGAVGFVPRLAGPLYPVCLLRCDVATGTPLRNGKGFCIRCQPGEPGVFAGKIDHKRAVNSFAGYADSKATQKKVINNVFSEGDLYFNTGDILVQDEFGYFYFKDRTGDTFRWKGENVATSEVEAVISNVADLKDAIVYGVEIPGTEGRAGMAAIVDTSDCLDVDKLAKGFKVKLPAYAIPVFLRVMKSVPMTGTFKLKKTDLQPEGFNVYKVKDALYVYDAKKGQYLRLNEQMYEDIMSLKIRL